MLAALAVAPRSVGELQRLLGYAFSDVSRHLAALRACGLVQDHQMKKQRIQRLTRATVVRFEAGLMFIEITSESPARHLTLSHDSTPARCRRSPRRQPHHRERRRLNPSGAHALNVLEEIEPTQKALRLQCALLGSQ